MEGHAWEGYKNILEKIQRDINDKGNDVVVVIDYYHGTREKEIYKNLIEPLKATLTMRCEDAKLPETILSKVLEHELSDDRVFGVLSTRTMADFYDCEKVKAIKGKIASTKGIRVLYGVGASFITKGDILIYGDLSRWEIQLRYRSKELDNWGVGNYDEDILRKYKRGYFVEWRVMDRHKVSIFDEIDYIMETNVKNEPKMMSKGAFDVTLDTFAKQPFRLVPYFDEGIWGGRWMEEVCDLKRRENNYAWCFDGVPEENAIRATVSGVTLELPAMDLVKRKPIEVLGKKVFSRFGAEFPIRFDFLDTMGGGNLSLQVHPLSEYIQQNFGMHYTQDESYYILDARDGACVYLGVKDGVKEEELIPALVKSQDGKTGFDDKKFINCYPIKKHDHILIPAGTIHCSGSEAMVLEISATPYIFTMKLWDWGRVGLDGLPRPINVERGAASIQYDRTTKWCKDNLINNIQTLKDDEDVRVERTGLHEWEFIETRRYWFKKRLVFSCDESVNMLNLIEGEEALITSCDESFEPFIVHYAETFILPEQVKEYAIEPYGKSLGKEIAVIKASVRV
ncbi:MAG: class I mannose-6-phosphate isomerase [Longicatena sp.]